jgi:3-oxoacyl-[acyl-carrier protein] reductase
LIILLVHDQKNKIYLEGKDTMGPSLTRKHALITGASRGIGRAIAIQLANDGFDIAFCYKQDEQGAKEVQVEIEKMGNQVFMKSCNISDYNEVENFIRAVEEKIGVCDVVVNNAGIVRDKPLLMMTPEDWNEVINTNLTGTFNICRCSIFEFMKQKSGCIINISSVSGIYGNPKQTNYSASKAGIIGFSKALAKEVGPYGIRVNVVAPGFIDTDMTNQIDLTQKSHVISNIPLRRMGNGRDVADIVSFLASEKASYITGQVFGVDGGIVI